MLSEKYLDILEEQAQNAVFHKDAFNCKKCPKHGCPAWWDFKWHLYNETLKQNSEKHIQGCSFRLQPIFLADMITTTYTSIDSTRDLLKGFVKASDKMDQQTDLIKKGILSMLQLLHTKDVQKIVAENQELRNQLKLSTEIINVSSLDVIDVETKDVETKGELENG